MRTATSLVLAALLLATPTTQAFQAASRITTMPVAVPAATSPLFSAAASTDSGEVSSSSTNKISRREQIRQEGGPLAFSTKYGALNPYAIYYGLVAIGLGIPWFIALKLYSAFQFVTRGRFDKHRRVASLLNQLWGETLMFLTRSFPKIENMEALKKFYKEYVRK